MLSVILMFFAMVKSPSLIVGCFVPNSVMMLVVPTTKSPVIFTFPLIVPPVSSYVLSNAVCNPSDFAMVKQPSSIVSCFVSISVMILVVPTNNPPVIFTSPLIVPPVQGIFSVAEHQNYSKKCNTFSFT